MTLRLSAFFETHIKTVLNNWKATLRRAAKSRRNGRNSSSGSPSKRRNQRNRTSRRKANKNRRQIHSSEDDDAESMASMHLDVEDDDDDDDDDDDLQNPRPSGSQAVRRNGHLKRSARANANSQNRVTSSSFTQAHTNAINESENKRARRSNRQKSALTESEEEEEEEDEELEDSDETSATDTKSSASESEKKGTKRAQRMNRRSNVLDEDEDSEESYKPTRRTKNKLQRLSKHTQKSSHKDEDAPRSTKRKTPAKSHLTNGTAGSLSQQDESTQEAETPLKSGRGAKTTNTANTSYYDGPSTSASALQRMRQEQQQSTEHTRARTRMRLIGADNNDHSYHLPMRNGRLIDTDSDSREAVVRPTRASVKRAILSWARSSDVEAADEEQEAPRNDESEADEIATTPAKVNGTTRSRPASSSALRTLNSSRQLRNRNNIPERIENDPDEGSDDEPLSQRISQNNRPPSHVANVNSHNRIAALNNGLITRSSRAISRSTLPNAAHDHNYVSNIGTSTTTQNSVPRRILSRHQRNADELDSTGDPLENPMLLTRLRRMPSSTSNEQQDQAPVRRGRSRFSQENSQSAVEQEDADIPSDEGTNGTTHTPDSIASEDDSEDNQPLTAIVPQARSRRLALERHTESDYINSSRSSRRNRPRSSEVENEPHHSRGQQREVSRREKRHQKRPRYNEQTDDDDEHAERRQKRHRAEQNEVNNEVSAEGEEEADNIDANSSDEQVSVTVSSRGRVRKLTVKARERQLW